MLMEPLFFTPILKEKIWGGQRFAKYFHWDLPEGKKFGESWVLSDVPGEESLVARGQFKDRSLRSLMASYGTDILGLATPTTNGRFPLLLKFIDTTDWLSVQVHPDDQLARELGETDGGKTEAWYFLAAEPDSKLAVGLQQSYDSQSLQQEIRAGALENCLAYLQVSPGETVFIPAGLIHAIGAGFLLAEVQQTSDLTYRLYDWGRIDAQGKPRELHLPKALQAINYQLGAPAAQKPKWRSPIRGFREGLLTACHFFKMSCIEIEDTVILRTARKPLLLMAVEGGGEIGWGEHHRQPFDAGDALLIPASLPVFELLSAQETTRCLQIEPGPF